MISWTLCWTRLAFIVFDNQRVSIQPLSTPILCPSTKKLYICKYLDIFEPRLLVCASLPYIILKYGISCNLSMNLLTIFKNSLDFNPNSSLAPSWRVCSVLLSPGLLVTLNQCQWSQKCLNIFPSRTMLQFTGYVPLISTQWHHKIFSLITKTTIFIIHWTPVICEH